MTNLAIIATAISVVVLALYAFFTKRKKDGVQADDRLINLLKETVDELEKKVNKQTQDIESLTKKVTALERENETLVKVLQGRDDRAQLFYQRGTEAFDKIEDMHKHLMK